MSAHLIFDTAPLGSLIAFSSGEPRPPARFTRKLRAWADDNGTGRLVERYGERVRPGFRSPAGVVLHLGDFGSPAGIAITVRRHYQVTTALRFEIIETPRPGMIRVLTEIDDHEELRYLAPDRVSAEAWLARNRYSHVRLETVPDVDLPAVRRSASHM